MILIRIFDFIFSFLLLLFLFPILSIITIIIFCSDFENPFFVQDRIGKNSKIFKFYKFRSMTIQSGIVISYNTTSKNDKRITIVGKLLRRFSLDELPQFYNILIGDMSFVGPRPITSFELGNFPDNVFVRMSKFKPGLTGYSQVNQKKHQDSYSIDNRILDEIFQINNFSLLFYFKMIFLTVFVFFKNS
jgi:undecaprenyl phosphate N,N'-diacetylbacillosamine 1-phosphate transferase